MGFGIISIPLYGQSADIAPIQQACETYGVSRIEDAAEALGSTYHGRSSGTFGQAGIYSFNGNKIISTSLITGRPHQCRWVVVVCSSPKMTRSSPRPASSLPRPATPPPHYQHSEIGYNYRLSNVLAGIGRGQLRVLEERAQRRVPIGREARRRVFAYYQETLGHLPGIAFMPEAPWRRHTRWLTCITIDHAVGARRHPEEFGATREDLRLALEAENIEARPRPEGDPGKPMHLGSPLGAVFAGCERVGGGVAEALFTNGLCLPSGSNLTVDELARVVAVIEGVQGGVYS